MCNPIMAPRRERERLYNNINEAILWKFIFYLKNCFSKMHAEINDGTDKYEAW